MIQTILTMTALIYITLPTLNRKHILPILTNQLHYGKPTTIGLTTLSSVTNPAAGSPTATLLRLTSNLAARVLMLMPNNGHNIQA